MADPIEPNKTVPGTDEGSDKDKSVAQAGGTNEPKQPAAQAGEFDTDPWARIDGATEGWDTLSATAVNDDENGGGLGKLDSLLKNFNLEGSQNKDLNARAVEDLDKILEKTGIAGITDEQLEKAKKTVEEIRKKQESEKAMREAEANKKDEARKAASNRKREARRASLAEYKAEAKRKKSFFGNIGRRRKSAPADSSGSNSPKVGELEWRSFNTWVVDLTSDLKNFSISFNQIVSKKRKKFEVEPLKNDGIYNSYNPVYVIQYFKDFWDKIKGFYEAEKVELEGSNEVDRFIKTINGENWVEYGWENPEFSTDPKNLKGEEPKLDKNNKVIKAFEGWLGIIKKNVTNLQDKIGKENIENNKKYKGIDDESVNDLWQDYGLYIEEYNNFVGKKNNLLERKNEELSKLMGANDRKARETKERILNPIFSNGEFENLTPAKLFENFLTNEAPACKERGNLGDKYEKLKAILDDAEMTKGVNSLCRCLYDFHEKLSPDSRVNPMAKVLNQRTKNIREYFVDPEKAGKLERGFRELLRAIKGSIDKLRGVYNNVQGALSGDASIIGSDHEFSFGKDEKNCWHVYQNENEVEKEIGSIAKVYFIKASNDVNAKQNKDSEINVYPRGPEGEVTLYDGAFTYVRLSSYLQETQGYLSFENNFTPKEGEEIKCHYTDEEGKENSVTFNANGMAIKINRQGKITTVNENSNAFKQLKQAFEGNQSSSIPPQGDLDINNNEKNKGGISMSGDESKEVTGKWTKAKPSGEKSGKDMIGTDRFIENQVRNTLNKYNRFAENYNKFIVKPFALGVLREGLGGEESWSYNIDYWENRAKGIELDVPENGSWEELRDSCEKIGSMSLPYFDKANNLYEDYNDKHEDVFDFEFLNFDAREKIEKMGKFVGAVDAMVNDLQARCTDLEEAYGKEAYQKEGIKIEKAKRQLMDFVGEYNYFLLLRSEFAKNNEKFKDSFNKGILKDYGDCWWGKFEKYGLGDLSDINEISGEWHTLLSVDLVKWLSTTDSNSSQANLAKIASKWTKDKSDEEKLNILGEYHTEANKLFGKVSAKLVELNNFSERIKNKGRAFEGPKGKESGSVNSGANTGYVSKEEKNEFVAEKLKGLSEYKKQCEAFRIRHSEFLKKAEYAEIIDRTMDKTKFNEETWEKEPAEIKWLLGYEGERLFNLPFKYRSMANLLIEYFKKESSEYTKYKNIIDESNSADYSEKTIQQRIDFTSKAIESLGEMLSTLNGELDKLEEAAANGGEKANENVMNTNKNENAEQKEETKVTETVEAPESEKGAKPAEASEKATESKGITQEADKNVTNTNENEEKERGLLGTSSSELGAIRIVNKAVKKYNEFVEDYNGFVDGLKPSNDLKALITKVLKKEPEENSIWLNRNVRSSISLAEKFETPKDLDGAWMQLITKLILYLPEANKAAFSTKANEISRAIISDNDIDNSEKLKLMEKYNKMCDKMLNYTNSVLKRLKRKAEHKGYLKEETAEEKLLGEFVKKYNELLSRGYEIAQTSGNGSASGIDGEWRFNFLKGYQLYVDYKCDEQKRWYGVLSYIIENILPDITNTDTLLDTTSEDILTEKSVQKTFKEKLGSIGDEASGGIVSKSKILKKYHKLGEELFNETKNALDRLKGTAANGGEKTNENVMNTNENEEAEQKEETKATTEENKGLFSRIKGKASKLVRKGKKVVAHKLDNSEKELDAAQKELKVLDEHAGASGAEGRFVKQSVMDQPEYETFKAVGQIIVNTNTRGNFGKIFDKLKEGPSSAKSLRSKLKVMITDNNIDKWKLEDGKEFEAKVGVLYIGIAYLPSGSKGIEAACKGMSVGGIKENNMDEVYAVNHAMKKFCRDGIVGHALVKKVKDKLGGLVKEDKISKIESQFSTLLKLKREAAKLGGKAKDTAKKAAKKIGKSSVGKAAKSAASSAVKTVSSLPGKFKKSKTTDNTVNQTSAQAPAVNTKSGKKGGSHKGVWKSLRSKLPFGKKGETEENE